MKQIIEQVLRDYFEDESTEPSIKVPTWMKGRFRVDALATHIARKLEEAQKAERENQYGQKP